MSLHEFVCESNRIEGIVREPTKAEIAAHEKLLLLPYVAVDDLIRFVGVIAPGKLLRTEPGMDVYVGDHAPPSGGDGIVPALLTILEDSRTEPPYTVHHRYETLHPFMDGNGRSGRALWLWMMQDHGDLRQALGIGFLHTWYYQSLAFTRAA